MPGQATLRTLVLSIVGLALGACASDGPPPQRQRTAPLARKSAPARTRSHRARPRAQAPTPRPTPAPQGPVDSGSRFLPVGEPIGEIAVETPPLSTP